MIQVCVCVWGGGGGGGGTVHVCYEFTAAVGCNLSSSHRMFMMGWSVAWCATKKMCLHVRLDASRQAMNHIYSCS